MVEHWNHVEEGIMKKLFEAPVWSFLTKPENKGILYWLDDSHSLIHHARTGHSSANNGTMGYYDYSFMITPAFKALEQWIINIAPFLGVEQKFIDAAKERGQFSAFLNDDSIEKLVKQVSKKLDLKAENKRALRQSLEALNSYLKNLRHTPAHCGSTIKSADKANVLFNEIVGAIDRLTAHLIEEKVISD